MKSEIITGILFFAILTACSSEPKDVETETSDTNPVAAKETISKQQEEKHAISITGRVDVSPNSRLSVHVPVNSYLEDIPVKIGDNVKKGQLLAYIEHPDILKLQEDYLTAKSNYAVEQENFKRKQDLFNTSSISRKEYLDAERAFSTAKARYERLQEELRFTGLDPDKTGNGIVSKIALRAPIDGTIVQIMGNKGKFMGASDELMTIIDTREKWIVFQVYPDQLGSVRIGDTISFHGVGSENTAIIKSISGATNTTSRGVEVIALPESQKDLNVGEIVYGSVTTR